MEYEIVEALSQKLGSELQEAKKKLTFLEEQLRRLLTRVARLVRQTSACATRHEVGPAWSSPSMISRHLPEFERQEEPVRIPWKALQSSEQAV